jgi:Ca2+-binding EF-hand superfamily protein
MTSSRLFLWASALLLVPAATAPALLAQGPGQPQPRVFLLALDTDRDGQLSAAEIASASFALLSTLDLNHDGQITSDEYSPHIAAASKTAPPVSNEVFMRLMDMDANKDGVLTKDEVSERMLPMFDRGDTDHDGKLTGDEIRAMATKAPDPQGRAYGRNNAPVNLRTDPVTDVIDVDHDGVFSKAEIAGASAALKTLDKDGDGALSVDELKVRPQTPRERAAHNLDEMDGDRDGFIELSEWQARGGGTFEEVDTNHDGKVDLDEMTAAMGKMPAQQGPPGGPPSQNRTPNDNAAPAK